MKELFGNDQVADYVKFINENYELGQVGIIEKWFDQSNQWSLNSIDYLILHLNYKF